MRTAGAAVPPQFVIHHKGHEGEQRTLPGQSSGWPVTGPPVPVYFPVSHVSNVTYKFLRQRNCATSVVLCCGGFQPGTSFSISVQTAYYSQLMHKLYPSGYVKSSVIMVSFSQNKKSHPCVPHPPLSPFPKEGGKLKKWDFASFARKIPFFHLLSAPSVGGAGGGVDSTDQTSHWI